MDSNKNKESLVIERSINKIQKEFGEVVNKMAELAKEYSKAEGDQKQSILTELKELTAKKKELTSELDAKVAGTDKDVALAITESLVNEGRKITLKRRYTENHPEVNVGKAARIRNKVLEAIKDGKVSQEEFNNILSELSNDSKRWLTRNNRYFTISEEGISLSKFGSKVLNSITVNEKTEENPEIWVPGAFDKAVGKLKNNKLNYAEVAKLARKYGVDLDDAIKYVEFGWAVDLQENNNTNMKTPFIYESFGDFVNSLNESSTAEEILNDLLDERGGDMGELHGMEMEDALDTVEAYGHKGSTAKKIAKELVSICNESLITEAFKSAKLASILTGGNKMPKDLPKAFYNMAKIALDKIQDVDIIEMDPQAARKEKRQSAVYLYFTTNEKENPYAARGSYGVGTIPANTLLAITDGSNEWMNVQWSNAYSRKDRSRGLGKTKRDDSVGFPKSGAGDTYGSGISSLTKVAELADRAYVLDLDILKARYSTIQKRNDRFESKKDAIAFESDKDFKKANLDRYNTIISDRAAKMPIDTMVSDAIDTLSIQIKDALAKGEKGRYGDILVGTSQKGRQAKLTDASNHMRNILDDFQRYVSSTNQAEIEKKAGYGGDYYERDVKRYAKEITDKIKQIETFGYAW